MRIEIFRATRPYVLVFTSGHERFHDPTRKLSRPDVKTKRKGGGADGMENGLFFGLIKFFYAKNVFLHTQHTLKDVFEGKVFDI